MRSGEKATLKGRVEIAGINSLAGKATLIRDRKVGAGTPLICFTRLYIVKFFYREHHAIVYRDYQVFNLWRY